MELHEVDQYDILTNLLVKSKGPKDIVNIAVGNDQKLNYNKTYNNPKQYQISYVDALANLEEIKDRFKKQISDKNKNYNFFLDQSETPSQQIQISQQLYDQYKLFLEKGEIYCYTTKDTWTKGKDFFFIQKGTVMKIKHIYEDRVFADLSYRDKVGLIKLTQLKIILSNPQFDAED